MIGVCLLVPRDGWRDRKLDSVVFIWVYVKCVAPAEHGFSTILFDFQICKNLLEAKPSDIRIALLFIALLCNKTNSNYDLAFEKHFYQMGKSGKLSKHASAMLKVYLFLTKKYNSLPCLRCESKILPCTNRKIPFKPEGNNLYFENNKKKQLAIRKKRFSSTCENFPIEIKDLADRIMEERRGRYSTIIPSACQIQSITWTTFLPLQKIYVAEFCETIYSGVKHL